MKSHWDIMGRSAATLAIVCGLLDGSVVAGTRGVVLNQPVSLKEVATAAFKGAEDGALAGLATGFVFSIGSRRLKKKGQDTAPGVPPPQ